MLSSVVRRASVSDLSPQAAAAAQQLIPPLQLYRRVLRSHKKLPKEMRILGDDYVKAEFRRCRTIENPVHLIGFLSEWKRYSDDLIGTSDQDKLGRPLGEALEKLNAEQLGQLYELMTASRDVWGSPVQSPEALEDDGKPAK